MTFLPADGQAVFPGNVIEVIQVGLPMIYSGMIVLPRRLRVAETAGQLVGIYPMTQVADDTSTEMNNKRLIGGDPNSKSSQPTLRTYVIGVQCMVKDSDETSGAFTLMALTNAVIGSLYNNALISVGLNTLSISDGTRIETIQKRGINRVRYLDGTIGQSFVYLSTIEYYVQTETK